MACRRPSRSVCRAGRHPHSGRPSTTGRSAAGGELLTAARERLRIVTIVLSDASLSLIAVKQQQRQLAAAGVALGDIAWCALAESLGVRAYCASTEGELEHAIGASLQHDGPSL